MKIVIQIVCVVSTVFLTLCGTADAKISRNCFIASAYCLTVATTLEVL